MTDDILVSLYQDKGQSSANCSVILVFSYCGFTQRDQARGMNIKELPAVQESVSVARKGVHKRSQRYSVHWG